MHIDWLLDGEPRPAQIEALRRSYLGFRCQDTKGSPVNPHPLPHAGSPARGWAHFMQQRVGKTPTALNEFMLFKRDHGINRMLMLSPNAYKPTWGSEAVAFGLDVPVHVFESQRRKDFQEFMRKTQEGAVFVNYEALIYDDNLRLLGEWVDNRTYMGADESVLLKNPNSLFFKNAMTLAKSVAITRPMTGLPTPQAPYDLWSQLRFARQLNGFGFHAFKYTFTKMGGFRNRQPRGLKNEERLGSLLEDCSFRARRVDWGTKLDSDFEVAKLVMTPQQKRVYDEMEQDFVAWLDSGQGVAVDQVITKRMKMQQISSGFIHDEEGRAHEILPFVKTPKYKDLIFRLKEQTSNKTVVVAHYTTTIDALRAALTKEGLNPALIAGAGTMRRHEIDADSEKARFNGDPACRVLIGQSQAIKYGHTLMGSKEDPCLSMVFFENNYSLDDRAQSEERPQGEGQQAAIHILDYFSSSIERDIVRALQKKEDVARVIMRGAKVGAMG